jgi:hypothetical protein
MTFRFLQDAFIPDQHDVFVLVTRSATQNGACCHRKYECWSLTSLVSEGGCSGA